MTFSNETAAVRKSLGKWSQVGVPHKGWHCVGTEDLTSGGMQTCEMCESAEIRYAHSMEHHDYPRVLVVGCICAGHMEQDLLGATRRERVVRNRSNERKRWTTRRWRVSQGGNEYLQASGYRVVIRRTHRGWRATVARNSDGYVRHGQRDFPSTDEAKLAAFDYITKLQARAPVESN